MSRLCLARDVARRRPERCTRSRVSRQVYIHMSPERGAGDGRKGTGARNRTGRDGLRWDVGSGGREGWERGRGPVSVQRKATCKSSKILYDKLSGKRETARTHARTLKMNNGGNRHHFPEKGRSSCCHGAVEWEQKLRSCLRRRGRKSGTLEQSWAVDVDGWMRASPSTNGCELPRAAADFR